MKLIIIIIKLLHTPHVVFQNRITPAQLKTWVVVNAKPRINVAGLPLNTTNKLLYKACADPEAVCECTI